MSKEQTVNNTAEKKVFNGESTIEVGNIEGEITNSYNFAKKYGKQHKHVRNKLTALFNKDSSLAVTKGYYKGHGKPLLLYIFTNTFSDWLIGFYRPDKWTIPMIEAWLKQYKPTIVLRAKDFDEKHRIKCKCLVKGCNNEWTPSFTALKDQDQGCPLCNGAATPTLERMNELIKDSSFKIVQKLKINNGTKNIKLKCLNEGCSHEWEGIWWNVFKRGDGCAYCRGNLFLTAEDLQNRVKDRPLELITKVRENTKTILMWRCLIEGCHCEWSAAWDNIKQNHGCPLCAKRIKLTSLLLKKKKEISPEDINILKQTNALVYILKCYNDKEIIYKIGLTTKSVKERYKTKYEMPYKYEILKTYKSNLYNIIQLEYNLHKGHKEYHTIPSVYFSGCKTECFTQLDQKVIDKEVDKMYNSIYYKEKYYES